MLQPKPVFSRDFKLVAIGQIVSIFGNQIVRYALPLSLLNQTGSSALFGTVMAVSFLPMLILYPIGGILADRVSKRNIMVVLDFGTALLIALFYSMAGKLDLVPLMAATMMVLYAIQGAYQPAVQASIPVLVEPEQIMRGNSVINLITSLSSMVGPVIGGVLFSLVGLAPILCVSIVCFLASAIMEMFIRIPFEKREAAGPLLATGFRDLADSFRFLLHTQPALWKACLVYASTNLLLTSLILIAVPVLITQHLGFAEHSANRLYGYAQGVFAAGAVLGGLLAGALSNKLKPTAGPFILTGCAFSVLVGGVALQTLREPMAIYTILVVGCGFLVALSTLFQIQIMSYIQILTPKDLTGKVIACVICVCMCTNPLGQFLYGIIFARVEGLVYLPFYIAALAMICIVVMTRRIFGGMDRLIQHRANMPKATDTDRSNRFSA